MNSFNDRALAAGFGKYTFPGLVTRLVVMLFLVLSLNLLAADNLVLDYLKDIPLALISTLVFLPRSWNDRPVFYAFFASSLFGFALATYIS